VANGAVVVAGAPADRPARMVSPGEPIIVGGGPARFVSRGGEKLDAALDAFSVDVGGRHALDAGASTGGFTDCLLQRGATKVVAVDVGRAQLHERLRSDPRVRVQERTNIRTVRADCLAGAPFPVVVADLSFISLVTAGPALLDLSAEDADMILLIKPQFEAGRQIVSKGRGVVRDPEVWGQVVERVATALEARGAAMMGIMVSPLRGAAGNVEFLAHLRAHQQPRDEPLRNRLALAELMARAGAPLDRGGDPW